jgi:hypothetical protein
VNALHDAPADAARVLPAQVAQQSEREPGHRLAARTPRLASSA